MSSSIKSRDVSFDVLRWIALTGIILVHSKPSVFWTQLRNFDVPLMVLVSAICFSLTAGDGVKSIKDYYLKRFVRLILPAWVFLSGYFVICYIVGKDFSLGKFVMCYTLTTSWYFWIIRILVFMAIIAPWLFHFSKQITNIKLIVICALGLVLSEILANFSFGYIYLIVVMFLPYTVYYCIGMNISRFSDRQIRNTGLLFLGLYLVIALILYHKTGTYISTDDYKYPPQIYYTSYALGISFILYVYRSKIVVLLKAIRLQKFASFVGAHTLWIYFWHIPIVEYMAEHFNTITTFVTVYFVSIFVTYLQSVIINKICSGINNQKLRKNLQMIFIG